MNRRKSVVIIDYKLSNLFSVLNACMFVGLDAVISSEKRDLENAAAVILPGVGAFSEAMNNLDQLDLIHPIKKFVDGGRPLMGICLGMQLLFSESHEFGQYKGLDIIKGEVRKFPSRNAEGKFLRIPQIGWNRISINQNHDRKKEKTPLTKLDSLEYMYFVHSFYAKPDDKGCVLTTTDYEGMEYCSSILSHNVFAVQFHPEKSAKKGIEIYRSWAGNLNP